MKHVAVIGPGDASPEATRLAHATGERLASLGVVVVTGGLGAVMAAASRGASEAGGLTVGLLPGTDPAEANPWVRVVVPTGLGQARNALVAQSVQVVLAIGGGWGTLTPPVAESSLPPNRTCRAAGNANDQDFRPRHEATALP